MPPEELSSLASSGGMGMAAGVGAGAVEDEDPESWTGGLGVSEGGDEAAEVDLACGARGQDVGGYHRVSPLQCSSVRKCRQV